MVLQTNLISKDHQTPVSFSSQDTTDTLSGIPHGIEAKKFRFPDPVSIS
jgi:hypothetical protein